MTLAEIDLQNRVERLESALLNLCVAASKLISIANANREGSTLIALGEKDDFDYQSAARAAMERVREAAEIVSGEHAPRE